MTSKNSFYRLRTENIKHRIGMICLLGLCFFAYMIWYLISVQNICSSQYEDMKERLIWLSEPSVAFGAISALMAVLLAVSGFRYLHSRTEVDFYHSLPVRRRTFLYITMTNDLLVFAVFLLILAVYKCVVIAAAGYFKPVVFTNEVWGIICYLLVFAVSYLLMALAMILTGHLFVALLGFAVLVTYAPFMLGYLYSSLASVFFKTYSGSEPAWQAVFDYLSPATLAGELLADSDPWTWANHIPAFAVLCVWVIVLVIVDYLLFEKRASEMAGKAMAFPKTAPVIRVLFVIPAAVYVGLYLYTASFASRKIWLVVGTVIGGFLIHGLMECIYQFDVRGILSHKKQMGVSVAAALVIIGFFQADIMGYDAYLPEKDETEAVLIEDGYAYDIYSQIIQEREKTGVSGETKDKVLDILAGVVEDNDRNSADYYAEESSSSDYTSCTVTYRLKNGKGHKRVYTLRQEQEEEILGQIFDTQEYREDEYALYTADRSRIIGIAVDDFEGGEELKMTEEQKMEFLDIFLEELSKLTYETAKTTLPVGRIAVYYSDTDVMAATQSSSVYSYDTYNAVGSRDSYYLYPTFVKTIQYLEEELKLELHISMEDVQITKLSVQEYRDDAISEEYPVSDQEFIDSIKDKLISSVLLEERECYYPLENSILDIMATVETDEGNRELTMYTDADTVKKIEEYLKLK